MPIDADQLDAFWMIVQAGGFHKAAGALFITQSAVTQRIRALEKTLAARLFVRAGRGGAGRDADGGRKAPAPPVSSAPGPPAPRESPP